MPLMCRMSIITSSLIVVLLFLSGGYIPATGQAGEPSSAPTTSSVANLETSSTPSPSSFPTDALPTTQAEPSPSPTGTETPTPTETNPAIIFDDTDLVPTASSTAPSASPSPTAASDFTPTPSPTLWLTPSLTPTYPNLSFPLIIRQPTVTPSPTPTLAPVERILVCRSPNIIIPDNNSGGVTDTIQINDGRWVQDLDIRLDIAHTYTSDLVVNLTQLASGTTINLLNRPGSGCRLDHIKAILDDDASLLANSQCAPADFSNGPAVGGIFRPPQALSGLNGLPVSGGWQLTLSDQGPNDTGTLRSWCIYTQVGSPLPPTPTPPPPVLPDQAHVNGAVTSMQSMPLDCESRVAVDYAAFFHVYIGENAFYYGLPSSDNPDRGFVGNVNGLWGQIPPNPYGVHAEPVAARLRYFGVAAYAHGNMSWEALRTEVAAGKPVFVWNVGAVQNGWPTYYIPSDGRTTIVANYQHVVQVVGYDLSANRVEIKDNGKSYNVTVAQFLRSWSALDNMAIISHP